MNSFQDAFISYGRADSKAFATKLYQRLIQEGLKIWFDQNDIPLGVDFQSQIDDGLEKSDSFLFIIAPHSVNSPYCGKEIELAIKRNKRIIPLLHVEQISRETWQQRNPNGTDEAWDAYKAKGLHSSFPNMHPLIGKINWVYFREGIDDFEVSLAGLLELLKRHGDYVRQHTQFLAKALDWEKHQKQSRYLLVGEERVKAESWLRVRFENEQPPCIPTDLHCEYICESTKNGNNLMTQVFVSYSEKNKTVMEKVVKTLRREGITIWTNKTDIKTGKDFQEQIDNGIEAADNFIYLISPDSIESKYCQDEVNHAFAHNKRLIPVLIEPIALEKIPPRLRSLQFIDCTGHQDEAAYQIATDKLLNELNQEARYYEQHKVLLVKALKWQQQNRNPSILLRGYNLQQAQNWLKVAKQRREHPPLPVHEEFITESSQQPPDTSIDVFVSYSRTDSDFTRRLNEALQVQGKTTWFDQESIASGSDFQQEIYRGIEGSNIFLFIISPSSVNSPYCADEVEYAVKMNKRVVTVLYRDVPTDQLHPILASVQWIDFKKNGGDFYANFSELVRALDTDREHLQVHTRLLARALEWDREGRDPSFLLRGKDLETSEQWVKQAADKEPKPTELQKQYIITSRKSPLRKPKLSTVFLGSLAASVLVMGVRFLGLLQPVELAAYGHFMRLRPSEPQDDRFLIVEVTDDDINNVLLKEYEGGKGTIPDAALNDILQKLAPYQPQLIGLDVIRDFQVQSDQKELATRLEEDNRLIGLCKLSYEEKQGTIPPPEIPESQLSERVGFSDFVQDGNSGVRRHLLVHAPDETCPIMSAFSLAIARRYLEAEGKAYQAPFSPEGEYLQPLQFGSTLFPSLGAFSGGYQGQSDANSTYQVLLNYRSVQGDPRQFAPRVTLTQVLENQLSEADVKDRIVMIGITARTSVNDYFSTPYGEIAGVVLQAQMASQIISAVLDGRTLIWWLPFWGDLLWILGWSLIGGVIVWRFQQPLYIGLAGGISLIVLYGTCYLMFNALGGWILLIPPALALLATKGIVLYVTSMPTGSRFKL
ncbi:TIR domain-containing protein [Coleofasciculus sp.]|uniref:TIR domain-containing protein n=1 Tax=Coleofasciculus sp. TaxID=3100458 RepID=UPI003A1CE925